MTKQEFCERLNKIETFIKYQRRVEDTINDILCVGASWTVLSFGSDIIDGWIADIATLSGIEQDVIKSFFYEYKCEWIVKGRHEQIISSEDLWDVFVGGKENETENQI